MNAAYELGQSIGQGIIVVLVILGVIFAFFATCEIIKIVQLSTIQRKIGNLTTKEKELNEKIDEIEKDVAEIKHIHVYSSRTESINKDAK